MTRLGRTRSGKFVEAGAPKGIEIAVARHDNSSAAGNATAAVPPECVIPRAGAIARGARRAFKAASCAACQACLRALQFRCGDALSIRARVRGDAKAAAGPWSDEHVFAPACEASALACY